MKKWIAMACVGTFAMFLPQAKADTWNERTIFTFSGPVEIPGQVLPAGTYVFKLLDSTANRDIVQVFNKNENHLYGTFLAIPDYHLTPRGKTILTFEERAAGAPEAIKAWFYPGMNYGHEFVYPKEKALALAEENNEPVPAMPNEMAKNTTQPVKTGNEASAQALNQAPLTAEKPNKEEQNITEVFVLPPGGHNDRAAVENNNNANTQASNNENPPALPHTATDLPLIGLIGLGSLMSAGLLRWSHANRREGRPESR